MIIPEIDNIDVSALIELYKKDKKDQEQHEYNLVLDQSNYNPKTHPNHVRCHDGKYRRIYTFICHLMMEKYWVCPNCGCENRIDFDSCGFPLGCPFSFDNKEACSIMYDSDDRYDYYSDDD